MAPRTNAAKTGLEAGVKAIAKAVVKAVTKTAAKTGAKAGAKVGAKTAAKSQRSAAKGGPSRSKAPERWRGDAVEPSRPGGQSAEQAAARAEGNAPVRAEVAARRRDSGTFLERGPRRQPARGADDAENVEEKRQSAAEDHQRGPGRGPIRGRL